MQRDVLFFEVLSSTSAQQGTSQADTAAAGDPKSLQVQSNTVDQSLVPNGLFASIHLFTNPSIYTVQWSLIADYI